MEEIVTIEKDGVREEVHHGIAQKLIYQGWTLVEK